MKSGCKLTSFEYFVLCAFVISALLAGGGAWFERDVMRGGIGILSEFTSQWVFVSFCFDIAEAIFCLLAIVLFFVLRGEPKKFIWFVRALLVLSCLAACSECLERASVQHDLFAEKAFELSQEGIIAVVFEAFAFLMLLPLYVYSEVRAS
jgi:hypothetical protein